MAALEGKVALVTGSSRGYGRAIAERLARDGALVVVHYAVNEAAAKASVASIEAAGGSAFAVSVPRSTVRQPASTCSSGGWTKGSPSWGARPAVDVLVNNAAISPRGTIEDTSEAVYDEVFAVNAKAPFFIIQRALPRMPDGGRIINISSQTSLIAFPGVAAYSMAKGALDLLTVVAAKHLAPRNITVNAVLPGDRRYRHERDLAARQAGGGRIGLAIQRVQANRRCHRCRRHRRLPRQQRCPLDHRPAHRRRRRQRALKTAQHVRRVGLPSRQRLEVSVSVGAARLSRGATTGECRCLDAVRHPPD